MKIRNIYFGKRIPFFCIAVTVLCIVVTLISQLIPSTYGAFRFMYPVKYPWQVISYIFLQGAPQELLPEGFQYSAMELTIGHLGYNLAFMPVGLYALFLLGSRFGYGKLFKQISFYVLMSIAIPTIIISVTPNVAGVTGIPSMVIHLLGLVIGTFFAIVFRKTLQEFFDKEKAAREDITINSSETV